MDDDFTVELEGKDSKLFVLLAYLTAGNWDVDDVATGVEYIKGLEEEVRPVTKPTHLKPV